MPACLPAHCAQSQLCVSVCEMSVRMRRHVHAGDDMWCRCTCMRRRGDAPIVASYCTLQTIFELVSLGDLNFEVSFEFRVLRSVFKFLNSFEFRATLRSLNFIWSSGFNSFKFRTRLDFLILNFMFPNYHFPILCTCLFWIHSNWVCCVQVSIFFEIFEFVWIANSLLEFLNSCKLRIKLCTCIICLKLWIQ